MVSLTVQEQLASEMFDEAHENWATVRTSPLSELERMHLPSHKNQLFDPSTIRSDDLRSDDCIRIQEDRSQMLFNCGGIIDPRQMDTKLKRIFPKLSEMKKNGTDGDLISGKANRPKVHTSQNTSSGKDGL